MTNQCKPFVSVIIPVFNDNKRLEVCLDALSKQTYPKDFYEVIVVDNNSVEDVCSITSQFSMVMLTQEKVRGSYAARNKGISIAKGDVFAFTDSDCIPAQDWLEKGIANLFRAPNIGLVGGRIEFFFRDPTHPTAAELYDSLHFLQQQLYVEEYKFGATANLFTHKHVLQAVGLFDQNLQSGGDTEWGNRVFAQGFALIYADDACIAHPARSSLPELSKKVARITKGMFERGAIKRKPLKTFIKGTLKELRPPVRSLWQDCSHKRLDGIKHRIEFGIVALVIKYTRLWEKARLQILDYQKPNLSIQIPPSVKSEGAHSD